MKPVIFSPTVENLARQLEDLQNEIPSRWRPAMHIIGGSRQDRPLYGFRIGGGTHQVSITAGAHSDEPAGPMAALYLPRLLTETERGQKILERTTWHICPHINPDGAMRNDAWFSDPPDFYRYAADVSREAPGDDVEFNYPSERPGAKEPRPENKGVAEFLSEAQSPFSFHASLHGMAMAEGAWWLIGKEWAGRTKKLRAELRALFLENGLGIHDIDRKGDKGFTRLERGFSTTPTSTAMREFFERQNDEETAALFLPSSMEYVQSLGGDPLVMVSELPIFRIHGGGEIPDPPGDDTPFQRLRPQLAEAQAKYRQGDASPLEGLIKEFDIRPVPWEIQVASISEAVLRSVEFLLCHPET